MDIFKKYRSNRIQAVKVGKYISDDEQFSIDLQQGSIIGPTQFILYVNDLCQLQLLNCRVITYADELYYYYMGLHGNMCLYLLKMLQLR